MAGGGNNHTCTWSEQLERVSLTSVEFVIPTVTLATLNVAVVAGNLLVVAAVLTTEKLRTVTNTFIVSLAVADLLVGLLVLPFSNANEVLRYWVFGQLWCSVWLAVDVWLCTASILNLCAISLDRYLAISRPFRYHTIMTPKRGRILVCFVWFMSFAICFPPLLGWNEQGSGLNDITLKKEQSTESPLDNSTAVFSIMYTTINVTSEISYNHTEDDVTKTYECTTHYPVCGLTSEPGYIVYSALGSFYLPTFVMVFFYWRIYRTAARTTAALHKGMLTMKTHGDSSLSDDTSVTLRVHRGGTVSGGSSRSQLLTPVSSASAPGARKCSSFRSSTRSCHSVRSNLERESTHSLREYTSRSRPTSLYREPSTSSQHHHHHHHHHHNRTSSKVTDDPQSKANPACEIPLLSEDQDKEASPTRSKQCNGRTSPTSRNTLTVENEVFNGAAEFPQDRKQNQALRRFGRKNIRMQLRKLNKEKKAAKTVGIIVGGFIICWMPFFTVYLVGAFCEDCTSQLVFSIFFWLGYCNSAINPCIYALFSKDFRFAFKNLLACRCRCEERKKKPPSVFAFLYSMRLHVPNSKGSDSNSE